MGIKNLKQFLKRFDQSFEKEISFKDFENKKLLLDASLYICMYKSFSTTSNNIFEEMFINLFATMKKANILLFLVFDGESPIEKNEEKEKRREKKRIVYERIETIEKELEIYKNTGILNKSIEEVVKKITSSSIILPARIKEEEKSKKIIIKKVKEYLSKQKNNVINISKTDFETVEELCSIFGIPVIYAPGEAEIFCSYLVKNNFADAVITKDSDVLACSTPCIITKINIEKSSFSVINMNKILKELQFNEEEMLDFCILCGTDYNQNIKGFGPVKSYSLIQKYKNLDFIEKVIDISSLNHKIVRNLFSCSKVEIVLAETKKINFEKLEEFIKNKKITKKFNFQSISDC
jgi:5'-3' exonuclease